jgi:hypothetical protein
VTAALTYQIIMTLPETEKEKLFGMLNLNKQEFDLKDFLDDDTPQITDEELTKMIIKICFTQIKHS